MRVRARSSHPLRLPSRRHLSQLFDFSFRFGSLNEEDLFIVYRPPGAPPPAPPEPAARSEAVARPLAAKEGTKGTRGTKQKLFEDAFERFFQAKLQRSRPQSAVSSQAGLCTGVPCLVLPHKGQHTVGAAHRDCAEARDFSADGETRLKSCAPHAGGVAAVWLRMCGSPASELKAWARV